MAEKPKVDPRIISNLGKKASSKAARIHTKGNKVITAENVHLDESQVRVIGGDSDNFEQDTPPAIVLEKKNDQISKIIVKCPCGRHAELTCEYDEEANN